MHRQRRTRVTLFAIVMIGSASLSSIASAKPRGPTQVVPAKKKKRFRVPADEDTSEAGRRNGALEITLGSVTAGLAMVLIGRGAWEIVKAHEVRDDCAAGTSNDQICDLSRPQRFGYAAAGLSFGFFVPIAVASGLLLARGIRINRDFRRYKARTAVTGWIVPHAAGLSLTARF